MTQIHELQHVAHELLYLGADGSPKHDFAWLS